MALAFDLRQLRYFVAVADSGSFRLASEQVHVSQPPLSRQVASLEQALGARLFERSASGVVLTRTGEAVLARARALLRDAERLQASVRKRTPEAALRVGLTPALTVSDRARLLRAWTRELGASAFEASVGFSRELIPLLKRGRLDFALVGLPGDLSGLRTQEVAASPLVAALPSRHRLARRRRVSVLDVDDLPLFWIARSHNPAYHDSCKRYFARIGYRPRIITVEPGQLQTLERIATGEGWTMPNGATIETRVRGVAYRPLAEGRDLAVRIVAAWRESGADARCERLGRIAAAVLRRRHSAMT